MLFNDLHLSQRGRYAAILDIWPLVPPIFRELFLIEKFADFSLMQMQNFRRRLVGGLAILGAKCRWPLLWQSDAIPEPLADRVEGSAQGSGALGTYEGPVRLSRASPRGARPKPSWEYQIADMPANISGIPGHSPVRVELARACVCGQPPTRGFWRQSACGRPVVPHDGPQGLRLGRVFCWRTRRVPPCPRCPPGDAGLPAVYLRGGQDEHEPF